MILSKNVIQKQIIMKTILFLDDERFPTENPDVKWVIVRTVAQAVRWIKKNGMPDEIYFDNDLQRKLEGKHFAKWLMRVDQEKEGQFIPENFTFYVHSQNSVNNIKRDLGGYLEKRWDYFKKPEIKTNNLNKSSFGMKR